MAKKLLSANARRNWFTITSLVSRDFKLKYRRSALGVLWSVLNPLLMMMRALRRVHVHSSNSASKNYPLYVILGNVMFALMADSTSGAMNSIIESSSLIKKIRIEKLIFPLEKVLFQLVNFCISLIAVAAVMIFFQVMPTCKPFGPAAPACVRGAVQRGHWHGCFRRFRCSSATCATCGA